MIHSTGHRPGGQVFAGCCARLNQEPNLQPKFYSKADFHSPLNSGNAVFKFTRLIVEMKYFFPLDSAEILNFNLQLIYIFI